VEEGDFGFTLLGNGIIPIFLLFWVRVWGFLLRPIWVQFLVGNWWVKLRLEKEGLGFQKGPGERIYGTNPRVRFWVFLSPFRG